MTEEIEIPLASTDKYEEALAKARFEYKENPCATEGEKKLLEIIFPELKDSEDERIRKAIWLVLVATEEDQDAFYRTHNITRKECTDWLEKQKEQKPAEWSEEDEIELASVIYCVSQAIKSSKDANEINSCLRAKNWLQDKLKFRIQSLRSKPHWKPSEEQMKHLKSISVGWHPDLKDCQVLSSLYKDLKKL